MTLEQLQDAIPDHARDLRINLGVIAGSTVLAPEQAWTVAVASAATARNAEVLAAIRATAGQHASPEAITAGLAAAAIMAMNNVYYRFLHFMDEPAGGEETRDYHRMPARLRMQVLAKPGVPQVDFELACLAASAITGCESCVRSHERSVLAKGGTAQQVQDAVRIAAAVHGAAVAVETGGAALAAVA